MTRRLIVNADDFGLSPGVNHGIIEAHRNGILTSATLMANMPHTEEAARLAKDCPDLGIGLHANLVRGEPLTPGPGHAGLLNSKGSFRGAARLMIVACNPAAFGAIMAEIGAQLDRALELGVCITHLDSEKHTHVHPRVLRAMVAVAQAHGIMAIRAPFEPRRRRKRDAHDPLVSALFRTAARRARDTLLREGFGVTDHFVGLARTGRWDAQSMANAIIELQTGTTELMVHPGHVDRELIETGSRLLHSRQAELDALTSDAVRGAIGAADIDLVHFGGALGI